MSICRHIGRNSNLISHRFATLRRSSRASKFGFLIIAGLTSLAGLLQIISFIVIAIETTSWYPVVWTCWLHMFILYFQIMGACEFLALLSGLIDCLMVLPLSIILSRTDFKAAKTADQWEAELDE